jgi:hypothetical protein
MLLLVMPPVPPAARAADPDRARVDIGPDRVTEADSIADLIRRAAALRRRLLAVTVGASVLAGLAGIAVFMPVPDMVRSPYLAAQLAIPSGATFVEGAILAFVPARGLCEVVARALEAVWISKIARRHALRHAPLAEALAMLRGF